MNWVRVLDEFHWFWMELLPFTAIYVFPEGHLCPGIKYWKDASFRHAHMVGSMGWWYVQRTRHARASELWCGISSIHSMGVDQYSI